RREWAPCRAGRGGVRRQIFLRKSKIEKMNNAKNAKKPKVKVLRNLENGKRSRNQNRRILPKRLERPKTGIDAIAKLAAFIPMHTRMECVSPKQCPNEATTSTG